MFAPNQERLRRSRTISMLSKVKRNSGYDVIVHTNYTLESKSLY